MKTQLINASTTIAEVQLTYSTKVKASERIKISCSQDAFSTLRSSWDENAIEYVEEFKILLLNRANKVLGIFQLSKGGVTGTVVDLKVIFQAALKANASSIILSHNHPSGNSSPSEADIAISKRIKEAGILLDVAILDHIILTPEDRYTSLSDEGLF